MNINDTSATDIAIKSGVLFTSELYDKINMSAHEVDKITKKRKYAGIVLPGGSRSGKTWTVLQFLIMMASTSRRPITIGIIRYRLTWIRDSIFPDFYKIMSMQSPWGLGIWKDSSYNKSTWTYTFNNGSVIKFLSLASEDGIQKSHGIQTDILYFNECTELSFEAVKQLQQRCYGFRIYDFNPGVSERHWIYASILKRADDVISFHTTYKDNPFLNSQAIKEIEGYEPTPENILRGTADETFWKIYGLGERAQIKGLIYTFDIVDKMPAEMNNVCYGLDFGFTNDPTALIRKGEIGEDLYVEELLYKRGLVNLKSSYQDSQASIEGELSANNVSKSIKIWADSAEQKSITDLKNAGYYIEGTKKQGLNYSVLDGINAVKRFKLHVLSSSAHLINELENYKWKENRKADSCINEPVDTYNHALDALRYACIMSESNSWRYQSQEQIYTFKRKTGSDKYDTWQNNSDNEEEEND